MRIIRLKLQKEMTEYLETYCSKYSIPDRSFIEDLYSVVVLKGGGLPDQARIDALTAHFATKRKVLPMLVKAMVNKRVQVLRRIITTAIFQNWAKGRSTLSVSEFFESLLQTFKTLNKKIRQAQCLTCGLLKGCQFGKQYSSNVKDITVVVDPDYKKKVDPNCPHLPEMDDMAQLNSAAKFLNDLAESSTSQAAIENANNNGRTLSENGSLVKTQSIPPEILKAALEEEEKALRSQLDLDSKVDQMESGEDFETSLITSSPGASKSSEQDMYNTQHSEGTTVFLDDAKINALKVTDFVIYELSKKLEGLLSKNKKGIFKNSEDLTKQKKTTEIKSVADVSKVVIREHTESDEVFDAKLAKKQLIKNQNLKPKGKKQLLYLLIDTSGSMQTLAGLGGALGLVTRASLCAAFCAALSRRVKEDGGMLFARGFEGNVDVLRDCRTLEQHAVFESWIVNCRFNGGGTDIPRAITQAGKDINENSGDISRAEILIITDAEDNISATHIKELRASLKQVPINVLDVVGTESAAGSRCDKQLEILADNYFKVNATETSLEKMINLIGGKKKKDNK